MECREGLEEFSVKASKIILSFSLGIRKSKKKDYKFKENYKKL